ncbi:hypothetical protein Pint_21467 [Pistacia integerrima]|uniref:Uncharacterized protein n=1 Tax=Pistacia integerrima TaxID=434235 RepID=A0ACC0XCG3_9ROSI|nr:hypothetical protein Pint_21467 [Pistacia integerrima]
MYLYNYKKNIDNLQGEVRKLKNTNEEVQVKVTVAERNMEEIKQNVKGWQNDVEKTITEAEKLIQGKENNPRCFKGLCPNWITRYKHSKKAFKLKEKEISKLLDKNILPFLPQEDKVTETPDTKKIQTTIAKKLGLKFEDEKEDERERASKLYSRMKDKNILLIVDNIWEELDLKTVGIPSRTDCGRNKMLMTTRKKDVLEKMGSTNNFRMNVLNEVEAWSLFKIMAGNCYSA